MPSVFPSMYLHRSALKTVPQPLEARLRLIRLLKNCPSAYPSRNVDTVDITYNCSGSTQCHAVCVKNQVE